MSGALPPVPDLIPISVLRKGSKTKDSNNCGEAEEEVMGEQQRSRRQLQAAAASEDAIDTSRSRGSSDAAPGASRKAHRKSDRRRDRDQQQQQEQQQQEEHLRAAVKPRVNPIFVWVRQKDTEIVEVKCEDYDKRNRILLTKTAQGWRAIPRTETLAPSLSKTVEEKPKRIKRRKRKSAAVQVEIKVAEEVAAGNVNSDECSAQGAEEAPPPPTDCQNNNNKCDVTPLDNLLAVAELEFNQQQWDKKASPQQDDMEQLDMFIESCAPDEEKDKTVSECDYNEEDDNNLAMDDILSRLEQSLRSPDNLNEIIPVQIEDKPQKEPQEAPTDLSLTTTYDELPTDLSVPKCQSPPKRPPSQNSETIQSPQPSGIPAVPQSPDLYSAKKSVYLESMLSPNKPPEKEPLDLGKSRESDSPKVTCSQEVQPPKKIKLEDITLKTLLDNEVKDKQDPKTPRLLELLTNEVDPDPVVQLKQLLAGNLNIPDPMLIPKDRLSLILSSPFKEIPKLLTQRPELRLPEALAYPHLLQDPDILVITLAQLETIVQKQNQTLPLIDTTKLDEVATKEAKPKPPTTVAPKKPPQKISELSTDIDAATNAAFTQMMWLPYLNQLEAMSFGNNADFLKIISTMLPSYPPEMSHMRLPFPPPMPMQPPLNYNPLELSMWQEAMLARNYPKFGKNPYFLPPPQQRPNLQIPQYKYPNKQKSPTYPKAPYIYQQRKAELKQQELKAQQAKQQQQQELKQAEFIKQQELLYLSKPKVACKPFANLAAAAAQHQQQQEKRFASRVPAPMDLSGATTTSTTSSSKLKVKHNLVDHTSAPRLLNREDVPEVGSTTASIEEMQDAQKHLWHPLFGNQKSYSSPWNWTTVTATGE